jgi:D-alanyl-D-alanine carboxypeptidase
MPEHAEPVRPDYATRAQGIVSRYVKADLFAGCVLVAQAGVPLLRQGFGLADREWQIAHVPTGKFRLGSLTKQFTATAILQLVERQKLSLEDEISRFFPQAPPYWRGVYLLHLLTHTSGIASYTSIPGFFAQQARIDRTPEEIIALTSSAPLQFAPGSRFRYNNTGYILLGHVIEAVAGRPYEDYVRAEILEPLGLAATGYDHDELILPERVQGYRYEAGQFKHAAFLAMSVPYAAGSLYSTLDDLLIWQRALREGKPIAAGSLALMFSDHGYGYGFAWGIQQQFSRRHFVHAGGINGFSVVISLYPDEDLLVLVLANIQGAPVQKIAHDLASEFFGLGGNAQPVVLDPALLADYVGAYRLADGEILQVAQEGSRLFIESAARPRLELVAEDDHDFVSPLVDEKIRFEADGVEQASHLIVRRGGKDMIGERIVSEK